MNQLTASLWGDEAFSAIISQKDIFSIINISSHDTSPPLYYILLHFWIKLFGLSEVALRSLSLLLFFLMVIAVYFFAKSLFGKKAAVFTALLSVLNPFLFQYAFEARMYMLVVLTTVLSMWFFLNRRWVLYIAATVIALYSQHFALFVVTVQVFYYCLQTIIHIFRRRMRFTTFLHEQLHAPFLRAFFVVVLLYLPWTPILFYQSTRVTDSFWLSRPYLPNFFSVFRNFAVGTVQTNFSFVLLFICIVLILIRGFQRRIDMLFYLWFFLPALITFTLSQFSRPIFFDRYLMISVPALPFLLATQKYEKEGRLGKNFQFSIFNFQFHIPGLGKRFLVYFCLFVVIIGLSATDSVVFVHPNKEPFRDLAQFIQSNVGKNTQIINYYTDHLHYFELKYYGIPVKIYSQEPLPFWVGAALITPSDILPKLPQDNKLFIVASGAIQKIAIPDYHESQRVQFSQLYLFVYQHDFK